MNPVLAFVIVMLVWTVSDFVAKKTKSLLSSLLVASIIFFIGFLTNVFPEDLLASSSLLALAGVVVGFIIVHLGTMISLDDFKKQWRTLLVGIATVIGIGITLLIAGLVFGGGVRPGAYDGVAAARPLDFVIAGTGALSGGTISVLIVQEAALSVGLTSLAVFPVLITALQGLIGFPLTSIILRREAARLKAEYRAGNLTPVDVAEDENDTTTPEDTTPEDTAEDRTTKESRLPAALRTTPGTLFLVGVVVLIATLIDNVTDGILNTFVVALVFGIALRTFGIFKPSVLAGIDAFGLMMLSIMILVFGPLATVKPSDVASLALPLLLAFVFGVIGIVLFASIVGKLVGYTVPMSIAIGLTALFGFPGTMILSQEAAKGAGETPEEVAAIEGDILPKMIVAGFATVTITSVIVTSIIAGRIGG
jgi:Na+/glutamate symporter